MYLVGVCCGGVRAATQLAVVHRARRGMAKRYEVVRTSSHPASTHAADLAAALALLYGERGLTIRKPRFSQVGRPRKWILARPTVLVGGRPGTQLVEELHRRRVVFMTVSARPGTAWRVETRPGRPGADLSVAPEDLAGVLDRVRGERRLVFTAADVDPRAVALAVWYEENRRQIGRCRQAAGVRPS